MTNFDLTSWAELPPLTIDLELDKKSQYLQDLYAIVYALNSGATFEDILALLLAKLTNLSQENNVYIALVDDQNKHLNYIAGSGIYEQNIGFSQSPYEGSNGEVWKSRKPIHIKDYQTYKYRLANKGFRDVRSLVVFPLISKQKIIGTVGFAATHVKEFDNTTVELLTNFTQLASAAIENVQLQSQLLEKSSQFEALYNISLNAINRIDSAEIYSSLIQELITLLDFGQAYLCLVEKENNVLRIVADTLNSSTIGETIRYNDGSAGKVWATKEAVFIDDYQNYSKKLDLAPIKIKSLATVPLKNGNDIIGVLGLASTDTLSFDTNFKLMLEAIADLASIAVINAQTFQALELRTKESELLEKTQNLIANKLDLTELSDSVTTALTDIFDYSGAMIVKFEKDTLNLLSGTGQTISLVDNPHFNHNYNNRNNKLYQPETAEEFIVELGNSKLFHLLYPLKTGQTHFGFLCIIKESEHFTGQDKNILSKFSKQLEVALENAELHGQIKRDLIRTKAFYKVSNTIQSFQNLPDIVSEIVSICREALSARWAIIYRVDQEQKRITAQARAHLDGEPQLKLLDYTSLMKSYTGWVMRQQKPVISDSIQQDSRGHVKAKQLIDNGGSVIVVPLIHQGRSLGSLGFVNRNTDSDFTDEDLKLAENVANQAAVAIIQHELSNQLEHQAFHDSLTGLPNRAFFEDELSQNLKDAMNSKDLNNSQNKMGVMFLDLDGFKHVNDTLGHAIGDKLLQIVAKRISSRTRSIDTIARLGGDEFGIIISRLHNKEEAFTIANNIHQCFTDSFSIDGHNLQIGTSIGISIFPEDGADSQTLLKHADSAMYAAKQTGKNNIREFKPEFAVATQKRLEIENDLTIAIQKGEFELHYQPKLLLETHQWVGVEALVRWIHPKKGLIPPNDFIPIAEESDKIIDIGNWVLTQVCQDSKRWLAQGYPAMPVAINISSIQFEQTNFVETIQTILQHNGMDNKLLELEVTESVVMKDIDLVINRLERLKKMDISIAIDDFGTGYSSLQYLNKLPLDTLKIDKSFVNELLEQTETPLVAGILTLAHTLGLKTVAEGVETIEQIELLRLLGCSEAQGFYFAKPLPEVLLWQEYFKTHDQEASTARELT